MTRLIDIVIDDDVLAGARLGRPESQAHLYLAFSAAIYALIPRFVPHRAIADDLFQDTFVEVLESVPRFRGEAPIGAWIRRIAVSKCLMYLRSPWRRGLLRIDQLAPESDTLDEWTAVDKRDLVARMDLESALARLPALARAVVLMHDVEGYTHAEIGELFGRTSSFSKSQLMRAHLRLRELLEDSEESAACMPLSSSF